MPTGALYQLAAHGCACRDDGYVITNGPAASPDGRTLYHTDTLENEIYAFDARSGRRAFRQARVRAHRRRRRLSRRPIVDAEGCMWYGALRRLGHHRYSPDGRADRS